jgi:hypothetical protein
MAPERRKDFIRMQKAFNAPRQACPSPDNRPILELPPGVIRIT